MHSLKATKHLQIKLFCLFLKRFNASVRYNKEGINDTVVLHCPGQQGLTLGTANLIPSCSPNAWCFPL